MHLCSEEIMILQIALRETETALLMAGRSVRLLIACASAPKTTPLDSLSTDLQQ